MIAANETMGAILAGGKSRRMGTNKALLKFEGTPIIELIASAMRSVFEDVRIVADDAAPYAFLGLPSIPDITKEKGPLGGIHAALHATAAPRAFVVGCDMPFVTAELIRFILARAESPITVVTDGITVQPLCGLYEKSLLCKIEARLASGSFRVLSFIEDCHSAILAVPPSLTEDHRNLLKNINNQADYQSLVRPRKKKN